MNHRPSRRLRVMSIVGVISVTVMLWAAPPAVAAPAPIAAGSVQVVDGNGDPIVGAAIELSVDAFDPGPIAVALADGIVDLTTIPGLEPATPYQLWVWANGYAGYWDGQDDPTLTTPIEIVEGAPTLVVTVTATNPPPNATSAGISGTVTDALTGEPIVGVRVDATDDGTGGDNAGAGQSGLDGSYYVNFSGGAFPSTAGVLFVALTTSADAPYGYGGQSYDGVNQSESIPETPVPVNAGETTAGIDARLVPNGLMTGTVTEAGAGGVVPLANAEISVWNATTRTVIASGDTNSDGTYEIPVAPGGWVVQFDKIVDGNPVSTLFYNGATTFETAVPVDVTAKEISAAIDAQFGTVPVPPVTPPPVLPATGPEESDPLLWAGLGAVSVGVLLVWTAALAARRRTTE